MNRKGIGLLEVGKTDLKRKTGDFVSTKRKAFVERAERIEAALVEDTWLPIGLRSLLAGEIPQLKKYLMRGYRFRAERCAHRLALMSYSYGPKMLDSDAIAQLRVLDLELGIGSGIHAKRLGPVAPSVA